MRLSINSIFLQTTLIASFSLLTSACEINGAKRDTKDESAVIISYFFSDQYAINSEKYQALLPVFSGATAASDPNGTLQYWTAPPSGCYPTPDFSNFAATQVGIRRLLDIGELSLQTPESTFPLGHTSDNFYYTFSPLNSGVHTLVSPGLSNGALTYRQDFDVLETGDSIAVYDLNNPTAPPQTLSSPAVPAETDRVIFNRLTTSIIGYNAPAGTDFIRLRLRDGSNTAEGDITCFAKPNETLVVPEKSLYSFRTGEQGHMELDFVTVSVRNDVERLKEGAIVSAMRHFQGTFEYEGEDNIKITESVGIVEFR